MLNSRITRQRGFTLMELSVVLVIVALLLGSLLVPLGTQRDVDNIRTTEKSLVDIREALIGFAIINGRLPCPAQVDIASGTTGAGLEAVTTAGGPCACAATTTPGVATYGSVTACSPGTASTDTVKGVLPWATLGLLETDAWGNRYTYHMSAFFGRASSGQTIFGGSCSLSSNPTAAAFALCTPGGITVLNDSSACGGITLASSVPAVVLSHGKNGLGAWTSLGTQPQPLPGTTTGSCILNPAQVAVTAEAENADGDVNYVSSTSIDDRLVWIPPPPAHEPHARRRQAALGLGLFHGQRRPVPAFAAATGQAGIGPGFGLNSACKGIMLFYVAGVAGTIDGYQLFHLGNAIRYPTRLAAVQAATGEAER